MRISDVRIAANQGRVINFVPEKSAGCGLVLFCFSFKNRPHQCHVTGNSWALLFSRAESSQKITLIANQICRTGARGRFFGYASGGCTFGHVLRDDIDGLLGHHGVERHQLVMPEFLHDLSLLEEGLWGHGARLQGLYGHLSRAIPRAWAEQRQRHDHSCLTPTMKQRSIWKALVRR